MKLINYKLFENRTIPPKVYQSLNDTDNPKEIAEEFSQLMNNKGFSFDYSLKSLEKEVDKVLEKVAVIDENEKKILERFITAYIGETIIRLYNGTWEGAFYGPDNPIGSNFYTARIKIGKFNFYPSHFIEYFISNGKKTEGTFYEYLYERNQNNGIFVDFLGGGLINRIESEQ